MKDKIKRNRNRIIVIIAVVALAIGAVFVLASQSNTPSSAAAKKSDSSITDAVVAMLTVTTVTEHCATSSGVVTYDIGALKGTPPRKWSDALSTPLPGGLDAVKASTCTDPLYGSTVANMFATLKVDGVSVVSLNPWLRPFMDVSQINDRASEFIPLLDVAHPSQAQKVKAVAKNHDYQELANRLNTLMSRLQEAGTHAYKSERNWHLKAAGMQVGGLPEVGLDSRIDVKPALILEGTVKNACGPVVRIGFNTGDKRPEVFATPTCSSSHPHGTPPNHHGHGCVKNCTPNPGCKHHCSTPPPHTCPCISTTEASQPVPTPHPGDPGVSTPPNQNPTVPADTANPAPPTNGGYNGGSTTQPGQSGSPSPVVPSSDPTNTIDPGGF